MPILNWLTRDEDVKAAQKVPYRLLEEVPELSYGDKDTGNMLIQGDNLEALKALLPFYAGQVKCIYIDPPFNTGQAFEHYDDNIEHSIWLGLMFARLQMLRDLLSESGTIAVHLDDEHLAEAIVLMDEVFGRKNRVNICTFKQGSAVGHKSINPGVVTVTNYIILYAKDKRDQWSPNRVFTSRERDVRYASYITNFDEHFRKWTLTPLSQGFSNQFSETPNETKKRLGEEFYAKHKDEIDEFTETEAQAKKRLGKEAFNKGLDEFVLKNSDKVVQPVRPEYNSVGQETRDLIDLSTENQDVVYLQKRKDHPDIYLKNGKRWLFYRNKLKEIDGRYVAGEPLTNLWSDLLSNNLHNEGGVKFPKSKKPEALIKRVFELFSNNGDIVLDSFLGSGTTSAVAHKMKRTYIGIEMGDHAKSLCQPRLINVVKGEDSGISKSMNWQGGGGFRFYKLGANAFDEDGRICPDIRFPVLAAHVWFSETNTPWNGSGDSPAIGIHDGKAYALLYNGILGDKRPQGGNVLTGRTLKIIRDEIQKLEHGFSGQVIIYGESSRMGDARLKAENILFKQTPYDVKAR